MREHEVPTHVQAEDRVLLWFTFPQIVAMTAVCALSYGAYRYAPVGPSEVRMAIAVLLGLTGLAAVVGKIGGRRLPLVAADLLRYRLGARRYLGPPSQLLRSQPPAPALPTKSAPGPFSLMAKRTGKVLGKLSRKRKGRERVGGRMPFCPHRWFGKPKRMESDKETLNGNDKGKERKKPRSFLAVMAAVALATAVSTVPQSALADDHEPWRYEIDFELNEPVDGRRIFVEGLTVSGERADVTLRAATTLDIRARAFGGPQGTWLRFWRSASLGEGESIAYALPLDGPVPSLIFSWTDALGQAGAFTIEHDRIPYPLPEAEGEICDLSMTSLGWTPGAVSGVVESECVTHIEHPVELQTVAGHQSVTETTVMDAVVTAVTGTVSAVAGASGASVPFVPNGETRFTLPVEEGATIHPVAVEVRLAASLSAPIPPLVRLTHHSERTEELTQTVRLWRPGASDTASETITVTHDDGTTTEHTVTAHAQVPGRTVRRNVTIDIVHSEHVKAEVVERSPVRASRDESMALASVVGSDDPFAVLALPESEPKDPPAEQEPAGVTLSEWFQWLGWEWPW